MRYISHLMTYYGAMHRRNIPVDFVHEPQAWDGYKVLIAPLQFLMTPELSEKLHTYVAQGGTLVLDFRSGVKDDSNLAIDNDALPCMVNDLCGLTVAEYDCLRDTDGLVIWEGQTYVCRLWSDIIQVDTAEPLAVYAKEFYAGLPAITRNRYGKGAVYYIGTQMDQGLADRFVSELVESSGLEPLLRTPFGVEVTHREKDGERFLFVLNHTETAHRLAIPPSWRSVYPDQTDELLPYGMMVFISDRKGASPQRG